MCWKIVTVQLLTDIFAVLIWCHKEFYSLVNIICQYCKPIRFLPQSSCMLHMPQTWPHTLSVLALLFFIFINKYLCDITTFFFYIQIFNKLYVCLFNIFMMIYKPNKLRVFVNMRRNSSEKSKHLRAITLVGLCLKTRLLISQNLCLNLSSGLFIDVNKSMSEW